MSAPSGLLDLPAYPAYGYSKLADRIAALLGTRNDVIFVQAEAVVALEAVAISLASAEVHALNIVTSPYGAWFGQWLRRGGAEVHDLTAEPALPITLDAVAKALDRQPQVNLISLVHAESASGILNPLPEIAELARQRGALLVVDAVASVGGHELDVDALGVDVAIIGPQKSLAGPAGLSAVSVSPRAWRLIDRPGAPSISTLSLMDIRRNWLDTGRGGLAGMPSPLEFWALEAALDRVEAEGLREIQARHARAARAARAGLVALGVDLWIHEPESASNLVTAARLPQGVDAAALAALPASLAIGLSQGVGPGADALIRLNHTGLAASREMVLAGIEALDAGLTSAGASADLPAARSAVDRTYSA